MSDEATPAVFQPEQPVPPDVAADGGAVGARLPTFAQARFLVLIAALLWSTSGFFVKSPYLEDWSGPSLAFWRAIFASVALWPFVRRPQFAWPLIPMTLLFAGMNYTYLTAMEKGTAANAIWLQCTAPVWVLLVGVLVFGEHSIRRDWLMVACAAVGIGIIIYFESHGVALEAVAWGLSSSFFYAGVVLSLRQLRGMNPTWLAALNLTVTAVVLAPFAMGEAKLPSGIQWGLLAAFGVLQMGLPYVLFAHGLKRISGHEATGISLIEPILNPLWVLLAWGNWPAWWTIVGGGFILLGLAIRYLWPSNHDRAQQFQAPPGKLPRD
jgi:drug/metabolite transporter (DMT)-like permease